MKRRDFLRSVGILAGVAAVPSVALASMKYRGGFTPRTEPSIVPPDFKYTNEQRSRCVSKVLETQEGRENLGKAMQIPIDLKLQKHSYPRNLLKTVVDEEDVECFTKISGAVIGRIRLSELGIGWGTTLDNRRFYLVDRCQMKMKESLLISEDNGFMDALEKSEFFIIVEDNRKSFRYVIQAIKDMGCNKKEAKSVIMHPLEYVEMHDAGLFDNQLLHRNRKLEGLEIRISHKCKRGTIYFLPAPEHLGEIIINREVEVTSNDEHKNLRIGWKAEEDIRMKINPKMASKWVLYEDERNES